jgi:hypothetical protein
MSIVKQIIKKSISREEIQKNLDAANAEFTAEKSGLIAQINSLGTMEAVIEISWGDWKHEHLHADYVMKQHGFLLKNEVVTEEDGDDCYSSIHYYLPC